MQKNYEYLVHWEGEDTEPTKDGIIIITMDDSILEIGQVAAIAAGIWAGLGHTVSITQVKSIEYFDPQARPMYLNIG